MNPIIFGGSHLVVPALVAAAKKIPAAHLARFGLLRGPLVGIGPVLGAFVGGAATVAWMVPGSRSWIKSHTAEALKFVKEMYASAPEESSRSTARARRPRNAEPVADLGE